MSAAVTFLLGAGFSAPFGVPTMRPFLHAFRSTARQKYPGLYPTLERHFEQLGSDSDIEALLSSLGKAERLSEAIPADMEPARELVEWEEGSKYLKAHLIAFIIEQCEMFNRDAVARILSPSVKMLVEHPRLEEVHIFTTNYDRIVEYTCEVAALEFSDGFDRPGKELVAPWTRKYNGKLRLYKLHGSVSYYIDQNRREKPTFLRLDRGYPLPGPDFKLSREGNDLEPLMVVPTLEKDALGEPYSHLNHVFTDTMARTKLVVVVGNSLRDNHIVSAISYNSENVIVLLVDVDPVTPGQRISGIRNVKLSADASTFFERSVFRLMDCLEARLGSGDGGELVAKLEEFAREEGSRLSDGTSLTDEQQEALETMISSENIGRLFGALRALRGVNEDGVIQAVAEKANDKLPTDLRKAVAGWLGASTRPMAVSALGRIANEDSASDVRLEAYLALSALGSDVAREALELAKGRWPRDSFFQAE